MKKLTVFLCCLWMILLMTGCNLPQKAGVPPTEAPTEVPEDTPEPTETPTPVPQMEKIAFIPSDEVPGVTAGLTGALDQICPDAFECTTVPNEDGISADTDFVIFAKEPTALSALTARFPQTRFIVITEPKTVYENVWTVQYDEAFLPFLAGLATTSNAYDWRSVGLLPTDSPVWGSHAEEAFLNGAHYFCGSCRSNLAPYVSFPLVISLPGETAPETWSDQYDEAQRSIIYTVFLSEEAMSESMLQKLISLNAQILGVSRPPAGLENNWLATINFDWAATLQQIISRSKAGEVSGTLPLVLSITPGALSEDFSAGKTTLLRRAYTDLLSGILSPYTPITEYGE